jgi:pantothenate kinase
MDATYTKLAERAQTLLSQSNDGGELTGQLWIGISGGPGSGKTTLSGSVSNLLNAASVKTQVVPMDGYHYYRRQLDQMENAEEAHKFRGAPFTFNAEKFVNDIALAKEKRTFSFPSFNHEEGDPVENSILVEDDTRIVLVEGLYLLLNEKPWSSLTDIFDDTWFIMCPEKEAVNRLVKRHMAAWNWDAKRATARIMESDILNLRLVNSSRSDRANLEIESFHDS